MTANVLEEGDPLALACNKLEVGEDPMTPFAVGQRVAFLPNNPADRQDILGVSTEGLFQQYLLIPQAALERGMVIPCDPTFH